MRSSFVHLKGIGPTQEAKLWAKGIHDWSQLANSAKEFFPAANRQELILSELDASEKALQANDLHYFHGRFPRDQRWRMLPNRLDQVAYLDIETTGLGFPPLSESTTISFFFRGQLYQEHDRAKKAKLLKKILAECEILATFYGDVFDIPFLSREFELEIRKGQIDLCFWLKRLGFKGGLKKVQKLFPEIPARESLDIDGYDAVRLWKLHRKGVSGALETLLTYNAEDTVVLESLLVLAYNLELDRQSRSGFPGFGLKPLPVPKPPRLATKVSPEVYAILKGAS